MGPIHLAPVEWVLIVGIILTVLGIGFCKKAHGNNTGKTESSLLNLTVSTVVTFSSSIAMLGVPSEVWRYGFRYGLLGICYFPVAFVINRWIIPVLRSHQVVSSFEFLTDRFNPVLSQCAIGVYLIQSLLYLSVTLYTPSLALSTVVNLPFGVILASLFLISTTTTVLGGMKAVLLTDVIFGLVMLIGQVFIIVDSFANPPAGLDLFSFNSSLLSDAPSIWSGSLYSFWDLVFGGFFMCLYLYGVNQASVHRYLSASSTGVAKCSMWLTQAALVIILVIGLAFGWLLRIHYPTGQLPDGVASSDQLLIHYVFYRYSEHPVARSLFIGAMLSAALSTASSIIAVISSTTYTDLVRGSRFEDWLVNKCPVLRAQFGRVFSVVCGLICYVCAIGISQLGSTVIKLAMTNFGVCGGPILGVFFLALWWKRATSFGAVFGMLGGLCITGMLGFGAVFGVQEFKIPFLWLTAIGTGVTVFLGGLASIFLPEADRESGPNGNFDEKRALDID